MARQRFLLQGVTANTHLDTLKQLLTQDDLEPVLLSVAFVTEGGVELIASVSWHPNTLVTKAPILC